MSNNQIQSLIFFVDFFKNHQSKCHFFNVFFFLERCSHLLCVVVCTLHEQFSPSYLSCSNTREEKKLKRRRKMIPNTKGDGDFH